MRDLLIAHVSQKPAPPSRLAGLPPLPAALEKLILWCLEKDPALRPPSMGAVATELDAIAAERERPPARPPQPQPQALAALVPLRHPSVRPGAALATAATLLLGFSILRWSTGSEPAPTSPLPAVTAPAPAPASVPRAAARPAVHPVPRAPKTRPAIVRPPAADPLPVATDARSTSDRPKHAARGDIAASAELVSVARAGITRAGITRAATARTAVKGARPRPSRLVWLAQVTGDPRAGGRSAP